MRNSFETRSEEETQALGVRLGQQLRGGEVVLLCGDLGAGKTCLAQGVGEGLGVTTAVQSPTFVIVQAHEGGRLPLWHMDLYRLRDEAEVEQTGVEELLDGDGVALIGWADRHPWVLPADHLRITLTHVDGGRAVRAEATGPAHVALEACVDG